MLSHYFDKKLLSTTLGHRKLSNKNCIVI